MKELSIQEIDAVSGAGFIKDSLTSVGGKVGDAVSTPVSVPHTF